MRFSLRSLFVLSTVVAVLAWVGAMFPPLGIALLFVLLSFFFGMAVLGFWLAVSIFVIGVDRLMRACRRPWRSISEKPGSPV